MLLLEFRKAHHFLICIRVHVTIGEESGWAKCGTWLTHLPRHVYNSLQKFFHFIKSGFYIVGFFYCDES